MSFMARRCHELRSETSKKVWCADAVVVSNGALGSGEAVPSSNGRGAIERQCDLLFKPERRLKPYDIEVQRLKSMKHDRGLIEINVDALVVVRQVREDQAGSSCLRLPVEHARTLLQFAELDKLQPRSRRSGRA
jgi:hypothetical protein